MKLTLTEKILSRSSNKFVRPGEVAWVKVDVLMSHDPCAPGVASVFKREFGENARVWDNTKFIMIPDHFIYTIDPQANNNIKVMREFAAEQNIKYFYDVGTPNYKGVCHIGLAEGGHNKPGQVLVGTDSHTVTSGAFGTFSIGVGITDAAFVLGTGEIALRIPETIHVIVNGEMPKNLLAKDIILHLMGILTVNGATYNAIEFSGETIDALSVEERMTICNMVVECGAKNGIMSPNQAVFDFLNKKNIHDYEALYPDQGAEYVRTIVVDVENLLPVVAKPHSPDNVLPISKVMDTPIQRAYIGSCTGGKLEDFIAAAKILYGHQVKIPTYAVPATKDVFLGLTENYIDGISIFSILRDSGVFITSEPSCAACCGGPADTFGRVNEPVAAISTTNRNFVGRMGNKNAQIYLASPYTVAASAVSGKIVDPIIYLK